MNQTSVRTFGLLKKSAAFGSSIALLAMTFAPLVAFPATALAAPGVAIDTINGQPYTGLCVAGAITITGHGETDQQGSTHSLDIGWGDGATTTISDLAGHSTPFTFSASHTPTGEGLGITLFLYHATPTGQDGVAVIINQCVAPPTKGVLVAKKHVIGGSAVASNFTLHVKQNDVDVTGSSFPGNEVGTAFQLLPGTYTVSEDQPSNYSQTSISCTDVDTNTPIVGDSVTLIAGKNYACTITNTFVPPVTYTLTYTAGANGTISGTSPQVVNDGADGSPVSAAANTGYHFVDWSDGVLTALRTDTNVTGDITVTANFANTAPVIVLNGSNPMDITLGGTYSESGAIANDVEDGNGLTVTDITGVVNSFFIGVYHVLYNFTDLGGLAAVEVDRTVNVVAGDTQCSDGVDNDGDETTDYPADLGCSSYSDDSENQPPVITVTGSNPMQLVVNVDSYTELGATADDPEDGNGLTVTDINSSAVNTGIVGSYSVLYNFIDSDGAPATQATRTVNVVAGGNECNDGIDNDGDEQTDYPADSGCSSIDDPSENTPPVVIVDVPVITVTLGGTFSSPTDVHATDAEDGTVSVDVVDDPVDTNTVDDYTVTYGATDSDGASAATQTQTVLVRAQCADGIDNDDDQVIDANDPGCWTSPNNSESYDPADNNESDPADLCSNIEGIQTSVPEGMTATEGVCAVPEAPTDVCSNIDGAQATVPDGMTESGGVCTTQSSDGGGGGGGNNSGSGCAVGYTFNFVTLSCVPNGQVAGASASNTAGQVLGVSCGLYIDQHLKQGSPKNRPDQVTKLQAFLNKHGFSAVTPTGYFGPLTFAAVKAFQVKYANGILVPWSLTSPTGLAYLTTIRQLNLIECPDLMLPVPELVPWNLNPNAQ